MKNVTCLSMIVLFLGLTSCKSDSKSTFILFDTCVRASSCPVTCEVDTDCRTADGEKCCDYGAFGKSCRESDQCVSFCTSDSQCDINGGEKCCRVNPASSEMVCADAEQCLYPCSDNSNCTAIGDDAVCCLALKQAVCTRVGTCPKICSTSNDCDGQICCPRDDSESWSYINSSVNGICQSSCPRQCETSNDCPGQICCPDGICASSCAKVCDTDAECDISDGEVCCKNHTKSSPWYNWSPSSGASCYESSCNNNCQDYGYDYGYCYSSECVCEYYK